MSKLVRIDIRRSIAQGSTFEHKFRNKLSRAKATHDTRRAVSLDQHACMHTCIAAAAEKAQQLKSADTCTQRGISTWRHTHARSGSPMTPALVRKPVFWHRRRTKRVENERAGRGGGEGRGCREFFLPRPVQVRRKCTTKAHRKFVADQ